LLKYLVVKIINTIGSRIFWIRGKRAMLDRDLATLYETETKTLNLAVKRNLARFPEDFMFRITKLELAEIKTQYIDNEGDKNLRFQIETSSLWGGSRYLPYAFTEQGVAMLSGVLHSPKAVSMHINIMRAFVEIRRVLGSQHDIREQLKEIKEKIANHEIQLNQIYDAMENLLDEKAEAKKWDDRERIGFRSDNNGLERL
jgi:phage regulator Rha-like protein